jgi:hypothetical protein
LRRRKASDRKRSEAQGARRDVDQLGQQIGREATSPALSGLAGFDGRRRIGHLMLRGNGVYENQRRLRAGRAGNAAVCSNCGVALTPKRASRRQRFCSYKCRDEARRARNFAISATTRRGSPAIPRSVENSGVGSTACKGDFRDRASSIVGARAVIDVEILGGRKWSEIVSADGVRSQVTWLSRTAAT